MPRAIRGSGTSRPANYREETLTFVNHVTKDGHRFVLCNQDLYLYEPSRGLYENCSKEGKYSLQYLVSESDEVLGDYATQHANMTQLIKVLPIVPEIQAKRDAKFLKRAARTSVGKRLFNNGI